MVLTIFALCFVGAVDVYMLEREYVWQYSHFNPLIRSRNLLTLSFGHDRFPTCYSPLPVEYTPTGGQWAICLRRVPSQMIQLPPSPPLDPWASFDDERSSDHDHDRDDDNHETTQSPAGPSRFNTQNRPQTRTQSDSPHPLHSIDLLNNGRGGDKDILGDVSRPALMRLTSETERQVAESSRSGSERGSLDLLRMSTANASSGSGSGSGAEEVEVLVHKVSLSLFLTLRTS
jgi:hypothetical protein